jgi:diguanylate cyclase (GGDEF)-like protein/PAS domain S-box-containing protein
MAAAAAMARWAAEACATALAAITWFEDGQEVLFAHHGLDSAPPLTGQSPFASRLHLEQGPWEVPDARVDAGLRAAPWVASEPRVRFCAGLPLAVAAGTTLGFLYVMDRVPRRLSPDHWATLHKLAELAALSAQSHTELQRARASADAVHRTIVEEQSELISLARADGTLTYVNRAYAQHLGQSASALLGRTLYAFVDEEHRELVRQRIEWVLNSGEPLAGENRMLDARGEEKWVSWTNHLHLTDQGERWLRSIGRDITARKRAEAALRASEGFLRRTGRVAGVGGWELNLRSRKLTWSEETRHIHEVPEHFVPTLDNALDFYTEASRPMIEAAVNRAVTTGQGWDLELTIRTATGRELWVRAVGEVEIENAEPVSLVGAFQDIHERKRLEQRISDDERFMREITDNLTVRIAYVDLDLRHRFVNQAYCERFGLPREAILGQRRSDLLGGQEQPQVAERVAAVLRGQAQRFEFEEQVDGRTLRIESRLRPDRGADGSVRGFFATGIDITERHANEQALRVLTTILELSTDFVLQSAPGGELLYANPAARSVMGLAADEPLSGRTGLEFNTPETLRVIRKQLLPEVHAHGLWRGETQVLLPDGSVLPVSHLAIAHRDDQGRVIRYSSVLRDISDEVQVREELRRQGALLHSVTESLPVLVSAVDRDLRYRFVNSAFEQWHGLARQAVVGRLVNQVLSAEDLASSLPWAQRALAGETVQFERHYAQRPGQPTLSVTYIPVRLEDGSSDGFVGVGFDITPHRQEQRRLLRLAERDALTGLLNRAGFLAALEAALDAGAGPELALLYVDLDGFKPVNDLYGHAAGDAFLQAVAGRMTRLLRPSDAVARLGGDEFAVLISGVRQRAAAEGVAAKIVQAASQPVRWGEVVLQAGASVGVALGALASAGAAQLLQRADAQLYRAKQAGRGCVAAEEA